MQRTYRALSLLLQLACWSATGTAHADGAMQAGDRTLFRRGADQRDYCSTPGDECDQIKTKVLSGYGYLRGRVLGAVTASTGSGAIGGVGALRLVGVSAALPGAEIALLKLDALAGDAGGRLRGALIDSQALFFCRDRRNGALVAPLLGMMSSPCRPNASAAIDFGLLDVQWDVGSDRLVAEWLRGGFAWELLGNGFAQAHLLRSIVLALPVDLRSVRDTELAQASGTSLGAGLRLSALYRTPHWEWRLGVRHRTALIGGAGALHDNTVEAEAHALHNFFLTDAIVVQAGLAFAAAYAQRPAQSFALWANRDQHATGYVGLYLGWIGEPTEI